MTTKITKVVLEELPTVRANSIKSDRTFLKEGQRSELHYYIFISSHVLGGQEHTMNKFKNNLV